MYCGYITQIKNVRKHPNADRLQLGECYDNTVVVDLSYKDGQTGVYFPVDGALGIEFARVNNLIRIKNEDGSYSGGYLNENKRNIRAMRLRGEKSEGLFLPLESLSSFTDINTLKIGDQITILNGVTICEKYIPRNTEEHLPERKKTKTNVQFPLFAEHVDTSQLSYNSSSFKEGDTCYITLKMHGTSQRTANSLEVITKRRSLLSFITRRAKERSRWTYVTGTRKVVLSDFKGGFYGSNSFREQWHNIFVDKLPKGLEVFYEVVGWVDNTTTIMGVASNSKVQDKEFVKQYGKKTVFSYGCKQGESDIYVYRMTMTSPDGFVVEVPWETVCKISERLGVKTVPTLEKFIYTTWEDLMTRVDKHVDGADPIGKNHIREGIVVRIDNREQFTAFKHKNFYFKVLEGIIKDESSTPDIEETQELNMC